MKTRWEDVRPQQKLPLLSGLNEKVLAADKRIRKVNVSFGDEAGAILIADSNGRIVEDLQPMTRLYLSCVAEQDGKKETNGYNVAGRADIGFYSPEKLDRMVREAVSRTVVLFDAVTPPAGEMPVVLGAGASGILLHEAIGHGMEADFNRKGISIFSDRIGKPVANKFVNIVDEGTLAAARGAINVDDEGNPVGKTMLVENGILTTYLHDSISAKHYKVKPTGNGRRESYRYAPVPRMRATYMLPGPHKKDEIIASVKKGIYCTNFTNGQVQHRRGRLHLLRQERLPHRGRQAHDPDQGRQHHRQRPEGPREDRHGRRRPRHRRGRLDVRQGRPVGPGLAGHSHRARRVDHRRRTREEALR